MTTKDQLAATLQAILITNPMNHITKSKERFRKLWGSINKDNKHLTTERIEDLIENEIRLAHQSGRGEVLEELAHDQRKLLDGFSHNKNCTVCREQTITSHH